MVNKIAIIGIILGMVFFVVALNCGTIKIYSAETPIWNCFGVNLWSSNLPIPMILLIVAIVILFFSSYHLKG